MKNAQIRSFSGQIMEKYRPKIALYSEIAQAAWNNKNDPGKSMYLRATTAIGKEKLRSFCAKVIFNKNQYQQQVFQNRQPFVERGRCDIFASDI